jgi:cytochrome c oxidase assembly protein subunit 15
MNGHLVPPEAFLLEPWWNNFLYNMAGVQLVHRAVFWILAIAVPLAWWRGRGTRTGNAVLGLFLLQAALGIATLLNGVPIPLAAAHQGGAVLLFAAALWHARAATEASLGREA